MGRGRILLETGLQRCDTLLEVLELREIVLHRTHVGLHRRWGLLPFLLGKGKGPCGAVGCDRLIHTCPSCWRRYMR